MKTILIALALTLPLFARAEEAPGLLLQCDLSIAPISNVKITSLNGKLTIWEKRLGYPYEARELGDAEWAARKITLQDAADEITGTLYKNGHGWTVEFTRTDGWRMIAGVDCFEAH